MTRHIAALWSLLTCAGIACAQGQPRVCLAKVDDKGKITCRWFAGSPAIPMTVKATALNEKGQPYVFDVTLTQQQRLEHVGTVPVEIVKAFGSDGKEIDVKQLVEILKTERPVFASPRMVNPAYFKLFKKDAILIVAPLPIDCGGGHHGVHGVPLPVPDPGPAPAPDPSKSG